MSNRLLTREEWNALLSKAWEDAYRNYPNFDGVSLTSSAHPRKPWYKRLWMRLYWFFKAPTLNPESLETIEIEVPSVSIKLEPGDLDACDAAMRMEQAEDDLAHALLNKARQPVDDNAIEKDIQDKGKTAPRVTLAHIEGCIAYEWYAAGNEAFRVPVIGPAYKASALADIIPLRRLTLCVLQLKNGFLVTGDATCVSEENFDEALGRKLARQNALDKVWMLEGYLLKQKLYETTREREAMKDPAYKTIGD